MAEFHGLRPARDPVVEPWCLRRITLRLLVLVLAGSRWLRAVERRPAPWVWTAVAALARPGIR